MVSLQTKVTIRHKSPFSKDINERRDRFQKHRVKQCVFHYIRLSITMKQALFKEYASIARGKCSALKCEGNNRNMRSFQQTVVLFSMCYINGAQFETKEKITNIKISYLRIYTAIKKVFTIGRKTCGYFLML